MVSSFPRRSKAGVRLVAFRDGRATDSREAPAMQVVPYLFFDGTCNEALSLYARVFVDRVDVEIR